jgi:hypothetical protein
MTTSIVEMISLDLFKKIYRPKSLGKRVDFGNVQPNHISTRLIRVYGNDARERNESTVKYKITRDMFTPLASALLIK